MLRTVDFRLIARRPGPVASSAYFPGTFPGSPAGPSKSAIGTFERVGPLDEGGTPLRVRHFRTGRIEDVRLGAVRCGHDVLLVRRRYA